MADPTIQTFCCHHVHSASLNNSSSQPNNCRFDDDLLDNNVDIVTRIMGDFNSDAYNVVCMFSASLGIIGAVYQILPRKQYASNHRFAAASAIRGRRIIVWLAVADLMASLGILGRASLWLTHQNPMPSLGGGLLVCALTSAWTQYFYTATWTWTLCYAIDMRRILAELPPITRCYHMAAWIIPAATTSIGLTILYLPDTKCHTTQLLRVLPNYLAAYIPIAMVMVANPCLYRLSTKDARRMITSCYCQLTGRERDLVDAIRIKFFVINCAFYICWLPNLINGLLLLWSLWLRPPVRVLVTVWYLMALTNPLQALFNCLVYRRWSIGSEKVVAPWTWWAKPAATTTSRGFFSRSLEPEVRRHEAEERRPLLKHSPPASRIGHSC